MKPKRCTAQYPFTGTFQNGSRCTLEVGHSGLHTIIPPSGMDYAPDDEPGCQPPARDQAIHFTLATAEALDLLHVVEGVREINLDLPAMAWLALVIEQLPDAKSLFPRGKWATVQHLQNQLTRAAIARAEELVNDWPPDEPR